MILQQQKRAELPTTSPLDSTPKHTKQKKSYLAGAAESASATFATEPATPAAASATFATETATSATTSASPAESTTTSTGTLVRTVA